MNEPELSIIVPPDQLAGVWANEVEVTLGVHEFTLDFFRMDESARGARVGVLVARESPVRASSFGNSSTGSSGNGLDTAPSPEVLGDEEEDQDPEAG